MTRRRSVPEVRVRMYRQGLGDCFLVSLRPASGEPFHVLIDCGVLLGSPDAAAAMTRVANDIRAETRGWLDVVVATHEHWDHVSGFLQAKSVFDGLTIGEVWLAWTEDSADPVAERLRRERRRALRGLRAAAGRLAGLDAPAARRLRGPLSLFGAASGPEPREALEYLAGHPSQPRVRYHRPGGPTLKLSGVGGARVYVLGPPRRETPVHDPDPARVASNDSAFAADVALFAAAGGLGVEDGEWAELSQAFEPRYRVTPEQAWQLPFFRAHYARPEHAWRQIDADWLGAAAQLALTLDSRVNEASLALALELEQGGPVLLFPGDAQAGSWRTWHELVWPVNGPGMPPVTAADLLARTVLYKVGHHGSHGGTPRRGGLEQMVSPELVALVPVDRKTAQRRGWGMPFPALYERLLQKSHGRVLCADAGVPERPGNVATSTWRSFTERVTTDPDGLFLDYVL
jgi:beta-lactamase superfamily II metal-dependent hydrolase